MTTNVTYNFDAFEEASEIMRQCVANLSEKNARQQIASVAMQGILTKGELTDPDKVTDMAIIYADKLITKLKNNNGNT